MSLRRADIAPRLARGLLTVLLAVVVAAGALAHGPAMADMPGEPAHAAHAEHGAPAAPGAGRDAHGDACIVCGPIMSETCTMVLCHPDLLIAPVVWVAPERADRRRPDTIRGRTGLPVEVVVPPPRHLPWMTPTRFSTGDDL